MSGVKMEKKAPSDNWLGTNSGCRINLAAPAQGQININDIADGLSKVARFNGQTKIWYCVAEHSIHVAELVPPSYRRLALLHDATEAYLCDIPTPLKRELGAVYTDIEDRLAKVIAVAFGLDINALVDLPEQVRNADTIMAVSERDALQLRPQQWPAKYEDALRYPNFKVKYDTPEKARAAWLKAMADEGLEQTVPITGSFMPYEAGGGPFTSFGYEDMLNQATRPAGSYANNNW